MSYKEIAKECDDFRYENDEEMQATYIKGDWSWNLRPTTQASDRELSKSIYGTRYAYSEREKEYDARVAAAEGIACIVDRLDRIIELLEDR